MLARDVSMKRLLKSFLRILVLSYIGFGIILFIFQKNYIYFPSKQDFSSCPAFMDSEKIDINGTRAYYKINDPQKLLIFYHGNAGSACDRDYMKNYSEKAGYSYIIVEYAGYSNDNKKPSKALLMKDVENIRNFVNKQNYKKIIMAGESLGTSLAIYNSTLIKTDKMLLISPFYSLGQVAQSYYGIYPTSLLLTQNFESNLWMKKTQASDIEIIHGTSDEIISINQSKKLYSETEILNKKFIEISNAHHNDIYDFEKTNSAIIEYLGS